MSGGTSLSAVRPQRGGGDAITIPVRALRRALVWAVTLALIALLGLALYQNRDRLFGAREASYVDTTTYQAVFLGAGQVYFGRLEISDDVYVLRDVYYLNAPQGEQAQSLGQLVKRGGEIHGPADPMVIPGRAVLFFENMRQDSPVMNAIRQIKSGNTSTPAPAATTPRTATAAPSASR